MTDDEIFEAGRSLAADWPPMPDEVVAKVAAIIGPGLAETATPPNRADEREAA